MRSSQEDITLLDRYIKGTLDDQEIHDLTSRLETEPDLKADLDELKILAEGMRVKTLESKLEMMRGWEEEMNIQKPANKKRWKWGFVLFFLVITGYLLYRFTLTTKGTIPEKYKTLYAAEFDRSLILHSTKRSVTAADVLSPEQRRAYEMYSIQLFGDAIPLLEDLWVNQRDTLSLFYLGVSYLGSGDVDKGLKTLQKPELNKYSEQTKLFFNH